MFFNVIQQTLKKTLKDIEKTSKNLKFIDIQKDSISAKLPNCQIAILFLRAQKTAIKDIYKYIYLYISFIEPKTQLHFENGKMAIWQFGSTFEQTAILPKCQIAILIFTNFIF